MPQQNLKPKPDDAPDSVPVAADALLTEEQQRRRSFLKKAAGAGAIAAALYVVPSVASIKPQAAYAQASPTPTSTPPTTGTEGCSPGFWFAAPPADQEWVHTGYSKTNSFHTVFGLTPAQTGLSAGIELDELHPPTDTLAMHATAALLNASHPSVDYPWTATQVIDATRDAYISGTAQDKEDLKDDFDTWNNYGSDLCD
ncbi:MAG: twin-arginine translocation signal domain-containing protein [Dehalococcoidia bacterium]